MIALLVIGCVLGYTFIGAVTFGVIGAVMDNSRGPWDDPAAFFGSLFWPIVAVAGLVYVITKPVAEGVMRRLNPRMYAQWKNIPLAQSASISKER